MLLSSSLKAEVLIGVGAPLSGPDAVYGNQVKLGVERAVADINETGGFLGQKGRVIAADDGGDPGKAVLVAKAFVAEHVLFIVGHFSSAATVPASAIYADAGALEITPSAAAPIVTDRGLPDLFRTCGRDDEQAGVAARYLLSRHIARIAIVHDRTGFGKALADGVRRDLGKAGIKDVFYGSADRGSREFSNLAGRIKASNAQFVFFGGTAADAGLLARQLHDANAHVTLMGGDELASDDFATYAGSAAEGAVMVFPQDPKSRPTAADLLRRLRGKSIEPDTYVFYAYAAVQILQQAAKAAGSLDPVKIAAEMHSGHEFDTVLGSMSFDIKGDPTISDYVIYVWHKGPTGRMTFDDQART